MNTQETQPELPNTRPDFMADTTIRVLPVPPDMIEPMWPYISVPLAKGMDVDPDFDFDRSAKLVMEGLTQVWAVWKGPHVIAAFCTTFLNDADNPGELAMDIHGMGGEGLNEWVELVSELMVEWATANKAKRIIFRGRKALARAYAPLGPFTIRKTDEHGDCLFEREL